MKKLILLILVFGMASLANAAIVVRVEVDGVEVTEVEPLDVVTLTIGNDTPAAGGTIGLLLNVSQAQDGTSFSCWPFPCPDPPIITPDGSGGLDYAFPNGTLGLNVMGDWYEVGFTVPGTAVIGSTVDLTWSGTIFNKTPANASLLVVASVQDCQCYGDYDGDGYVTTTDLNWLLMKLFERWINEGIYLWPILPEGYVCMDVNGDEYLDTTDMNTLLFHLFTYGMGQPGWTSPCMPAP